MSSRILSICSFDMNGYGADDICSPRIGMISLRITSCSPSADIWPALASSLRKAAMLFWPRYRGSLGSSSSFGMSVRLLSDWLGKMACHNKTRQGKETYQWFEAIHHLSCCYLHCHYQYLDFYFSSFPPLNLGCRFRHFSHSALDYKSIALHDLFSHNFHMVACYRISLCVGDRANMLCLFYFSSSSLRTVLEKVTQLRRPISLDEIDDAG